jgi:hypothetical protein
MSWSISLTLDLTGQADPDARAAAVRAAMMAKWVEGTRGYYEANSIEVTPDIKTGWDAQEPQVVAAADCALVQLRALKGDKLSISANGHANSDGTGNIGAYVSATT